MIIGTRRSSAFKVLDCYIAATLLISHIGKRGLGLRQEAVTVPVHEYAYVVCTTRKSDACEATRLRW
jgi:hypothetical protein